MEIIDPMIQPVKAIITIFNNATNKESLELKKQIHGFFYCVLFVFLCFYGHIQVQFGFFIFIFISLSLKILFGFLYVLSRCFHAFLCL